MSKQNHNGFSRLFALALLAGLWRVYDRRHRERLPGHEEIEDPQVAEGFAWVSRTPQMDWMRKYVAAQAVALQNQGEAADLGCGAGYLALELARRAPGLRVTGVDLSDQLLETGRPAARQAGLGERVDFRLGNVETLPFPDHSLDLVVSTLSLHHWSDPPGVLDEVARVLKPGGAYFIFDLRRDMLPPFYLLIWFATQFVVPGAIHRINEPMNSRNAAYTPPEVAALARRSSLTGGRVTAGPLWVVLEGSRARAT